MSEIWKEFKETYLRNKELREKSLEKRKERRKTHTKLCYYINMED